MSPWTVLGWVIVALIVIPIAARITVGLVDIINTEREAARKRRRLRKANKGRLRCDFRGCEKIATRRGPRGFCCEEHISTITGGRRGVSFAHMLDHAKRDAS